MVLCHHRPWNQHVLLISHHICLEDTYFLLYKLTLEGQRMLIWNVDWPHGSLVTCQYVSISLSKLPVLPEIQNGVEEGVTVQNHGSQSEKKVMETGVYVQWNNFTNNNRHPTHNHHNQNQESHFGNFVLFATLTASIMLVALAVATMMMAFRAFTNIAVTKHFVTIGIDIVHGDLIMQTFGVWSFGPGPLGVVFAHCVESLYPGNMFLGNQVNSYVRICTSENYQQNKDDGHNCMPDVPFDTIAKTLSIGQITENQRNAKYPHQCNDDKDQSLGDSDPVNEGMNDSKVPFQCYDSYGAKRHRQTEKNHEKARSTQVVVWTWNMPNRNTQGYGYAQQQVTQRQVQNQHVRDCSQFQIFADHGNRYCVGENDKPRNNKNHHIHHCSKCGQFQTLSQQKSGRFVGKHQCSFKHSNKNVCKQPGCDLFQAWFASVLPSVFAVDFLQIELLMLRIRTRGISLLAGFFRKKTTFFCLKFMKLFGKTQGNNMQATNADKLQKSMQNSQ